MGSQTPEFVKPDPYLWKEWAEVIIVGSGFYGATSAEIIARVYGKKVLVIEKRDHVGGNAYSYFDPATGIEVHKYGSHLFHTSNQIVIDYLRKFTELNEYKHRVFTTSRGRVYSLPVNLMTINQYYQRDFSPAEAREFLARKISEISTTLNPSNLEDRAKSLIGRDLYEELIKGYTFKQWQTDPKNLPGEIISRLPIRFNYNDRYFSDTWEGLPIEGYESIFNQMLTSKNIKVILDFDVFQISQDIKEKMLIFTGQLDRFFDYSEGRLSWRTLDLEVFHSDMDDYQGTSVMNYADQEIPYTRIHEFRHLHPERTYMKGSGTILMKEFSRWARDEDEPFYPVNLSADRAILKNYREKMKNLPNVHFGGRLGTYKYLDMHMAIASALTWTQNEFLPWYSRSKR